MAERKKQPKKYSAKKIPSKSTDKKSKLEKQSKQDTQTKVNEEKRPLSYMWWVVIFASLGAIICLAIIVGLIPGDEGEYPLLAYLSHPILGLFGMCAPIIGLYFIIFSYFCYKYKENSTEKTARTILLVLNIVFLLGSLHIITKWNEVSFAVPSAKNLWNDGIKLKGNGIVGGYLGYFLSRLLHKSVGLIVGLLIYITSLIFFFGSSPKRLFKKLCFRIKLFFRYIYAKIKSTSESDNLPESKTIAVEEEKKTKTKTNNNPHTVNTETKIDPPVTKQDIKHETNTQTPATKVENRETSITAFGKHITLDKNSTDSANSTVYDTATDTTETKAKTENYVTGSIYDAPLTPREESKNNISENSDATKNKFGFKYGREARDESNSVSTEEQQIPSDEMNNTHETDYTDETDLNELEILQTELVSPEEDIKPYIFPPIDLLEHGIDEVTFNTQEVERKKDVLLATLAAFKVKANVVNISCGPTITRYEIEPEMGVSVKSIEKLGKDLALRLEAKSLRIEAPIPGKCAVGIEVSNSARMTVKLRDILDAPEFRDNKSKLFCCLGVDVAGNPVYLDIPKMPHLLIAGATGMGKSVCLNSLIVSLLYRATPDEVKLILIDPKKVEFSHYADIPHLLAPVVTNINKCAGTLNWAVSEMERRYDIFEEMGLRNLEEFNAEAEEDPELEKLPSIVIVIDELADLMMQAGAEVENSICRLAQKARAAGMYLILGTQRPSVDVITGLIKANIPSRIALAVTSNVDSRTILDHAGAESLLDKGDILYAPAGTRKELRVQGAFISTKELFSICEFVRKNSVARYDKNVVAKINEEAQNCGKNKKGKSGGDSDEKPSTDTKDLELMIAALEVGFEQGTISTSYIQRRLSFGYAKAARVVDLLQQHGFVSAPDPVNKLRKVTISPQEFAELKLNSSGQANEGEDEE